MIVNLNDITEFDQWITDALNEFPEQEYEDSPVKFLASYLMSKLLTNANENDTFWKALEDRMVLLIEDWSGCDEDDAPGMRSDVDRHLSSFKDGVWK